MWDLLFSTRPIFLNLGSKEQFRFKSFLLEFDFLPFSFYRFEEIDFEIMNVDKLIESAKTSRWGLFKLNFLLQRFIPFNRPHGLKVVHIADDEVKVKIPYWRINQNHLKGIHACCSATAAEYSSGFLLLHKLGMKNYRIIMESMEVSYKYQGKSESYATFTLDETDFKTSVLAPLEKDGVVYKKCTIEVHDKDQNLLCVATTNWQIKTWKKVKTKVD